MCHWATYIVTHIYTQGQSRCLGTFQGCMLAVSQIYANLAANQSGVSLDDLTIIKQQKQACGKGPYCH